MDPLHTRELQAYRHEFQHFVNIMNSYMANQLFYLTWREFEIELAQNVSDFSIGHVTSCHGYYVYRYIALMS